MVIFVVLFMILVNRLFTMQIVEGESYLNSFDVKSKKERTIDAARGNIYDRNGVLLAYNELAYCVKIEDVYGTEDDVVEKIVYAKTHTDLLFFSNLGKVDLPPDMAEEITGMDFLLGTSFFHRAQVTGCAVNGITTLSISKYTKDPSFEERLYNIFKDDGLDVVVEGSEYNGN